MSASGKVSCVHVGAVGWEASRALRFSCSLNSVARSCRTVGLVEQDGGNTTLNHGIKLVTTLKRVVVNCDYVRVATVILPSRNNRGRKCGRARLDLDAVVSVVPHVLCHDVFCPRAHTRSATRRSTRPRAHRQQAEDAGRSGLFTI